MKHYLKRLKKVISRWFVILSLLISPVRSTLMYLEIALSTMILKSGKEGLSDDELIRFISLINNDYTTNDINLPYHSIDIVWYEGFLDSPTKTSDGENTIRNVMADSESLKKNIEPLMDTILLNLPPALQLKLGLHCAANKMYLKHIMKNYVHSHF